MGELEDASPGSAAAAAAVEPDLGFGSVVAREARTRLLNRDGTFNVRREGLPLSQSLSAYHYLLTVSWPKFLGFVVGAYVLVNVVFASLYVACGDDSLSAFAREAGASHFRTAFFFSVQTLATIGYGAITPQNLAANVVVTVESLFGLLGMAMVAGIMFARFSRPVARIVFSDRALVAPYRGGKAFMFRIVNQRSSEIVNMQAKVLFAKRKEAGDGARTFVSLKLERDSVVFFPLAWTLVHPIDESSPLWQLDSEALRSCDVEFLVLLDGFDETFSQTVHARSSYRADEVVWGAQFRSVFNAPRADGTISVDIRKLHEYETV